jgi:hypothetical protein
MLRWLGWFAVLACAAVAAWHLQPAPSFQGKPLSHWRATIQGEPRKPSFHPWKTIVSPLSTGDVNALPVLVTLAKHPDDQWVRKKAVRYLAKQVKDPRRAIAALSAALVDPSEHVRLEAARGLGEFGPDAAAAVVPLRQALHDSSGLVRIAAAESLWQVTGDAREALPVLIAEVDIYPREVADVLSAMGPEARDAVPVLLERIPRDGREHWALWGALQRMGYTHPDFRKAIEPTK